MITVKVTDNAVKKAMARLSRRMADPSPVMLAISEALKTQTSDNFSAQAGPLGKWPPLKYKRKGRDTNPQILTDSARLRNSITATHSRNTAVVGTNVVYAAIHQFGGTINMPARSQLSYFKQDKRGSVGRLFVRKDAANYARWHTRGDGSIDMPARPFLPFANGKLQAGMESLIMEEIARFLVGK
jgi:phage virion morphogenesis protein